MTIQSNFKKAKRIGTPIIVIETPDQYALVKELSNLEEAGDSYVWDCVDGLSCVNYSENFAGVSDPSTLSPVLTVKASMNAPSHSTIFLLNANRQLECKDDKASAFNQAIHKIRDQFKTNGKTLVLLGPVFTIPSELRNDVLELEDPYPTINELATVVEKHSSFVKESFPEFSLSSEEISKVSEELVGLPRFSAEQAFYMSITKKGVDFESLRERKIKLINKTPGLRIYTGKETFDDIGGCENVKTFLSRVISGKDSPKAIVFIDEGEKMFAGSFSGVGDNTGVSQDILATTLQYMEDNSCDGSIFVGPPGAAKSAIAKAVGNEAKIPTIVLDMGEVKDSTVGSSERRIREAYKVIDAVSNGRAYFIMTCNKESMLPPELKRRYTNGTFFFDLPTEVEASIIWSIYKTKYGLKENEIVPSSHRWTGAEIRNCCRIAYRQGISLIEASSFIVPVAVSSREAIDTLRQSASGRFISASTPGIYK